MNLLDRIMLKFGFIRLDLYKERESDLNYYHDAFKEGYEIIEDLIDENIDIQDENIKEFLMNYSIFNY